MRSLPTLLAGLVLAGCAGGPGPARAPRTVADLRRVFRPALEPLSVLCDTLEVDLSHELWDQVAHPAGSARHRLVHRRGEPSVYRFENVNGGLDYPLKFRIGRQNYLVLQSAVFRLHAKGPARFDLVCGGEILVNRDSASGPSRRTVFRIHDGSSSER